MALGAPDVVEVVVLAAGAGALLRAHGTAERGRLVADEVRLERHHAGDGEQHGRVVRDQARRRHDGVVLGREELPERVTELVGGHRPVSRIRAYRGLYPAAPWVNVRSGPLSNRTSTSSSRSRIPTEQRTWEFDATFLRSNYKCIYGEGCKGVLDGPAEELQQGCCSYGAHLIDDDDVQIVVQGVRAGQARADAVPRQGRARRVHASGRSRQRRSTDHHHAPRRRCLHLLEPARVRGRRRLRAAHRRPRGRRTATRLEAERVLAGADPARAPHRRQRPRHVTPARVEAPRLGRRRQRLPLVVHRVAGGVRRSRAGLQVEPRRDPRARRRPHLRPDGGAARAARDGPRSPIPPSVADSAELRRPRFSRRNRRRRRS